MRPNLPTIPPTPTETPDAKPVLSQQQALPVGSASPIDRSLAPVRDSRPDTADGEAFALAAHLREAVMKLHLSTLASTHESARRVAARKSVWMVLWLRARRDGDCLRAFYRRQHLAGIRP